jgi:hypothetical protein
MRTNKWLFVGLLTLLSVGWALAAPPAVHPTTGAPLVITCLKGTPEAIDGNLSDWNLDAMTPAVLDATQCIPGRRVDRPGGLQRQVLSEWDDKKVYSPSW